MKLLHYCAFRKKNLNASEFLSLTELLVYFFCNKFKTNQEQKLAIGELKMNMLLQLTDASF